MEYVYCVIRFGEKVYKSLYKSTCMSVSESVCLDVPLLLRNGEPQRAEILRDDSPWDAECFRLKTSRFVEPLAEQ